MVNSTNYEPVIGRSRFSICASGVAHPRRICSSSDSGADSIPSNIAIRTTKKNLTVVLTTDLPERSARLQPEQPVVIRLQRVQKIRCRSQTEFFHDGRRTEADRGGEADGRRGRDQTGLGKLQSPALRSGDRQAPRAPDR